jgi:MFS family permease
VPVVGFGLVSFLSDAGHESATAVLPAYLAILGAPPAALGLIEGVADGLSTLAKLLGGWWADRPALRKPIAVAGYLVTGLSTGACSLAVTWPSLLAARTAGWVARGIRGPARDAMLAGAVEPRNLGRAFGFHRAMDTAGAVAGPATVAVLLATWSSRDIFALSLVPGVLAAVVFAALVPAAREPGGTNRRPFAEGLRALSPSFRRFLGAVFAFGLGDFARTLLILRASEVLAPSLGKSSAAAAAVSLYVLHNLLYAVASYPVGRLADRFPAGRLLSIGYACGTATAALAAVIGPSLGAFAILFAVAGLTLAFEDTLEGVLTARLVPAERRGTAYGVLAAVNGLGDLVSSSFVGLLWTVAGPGPAFAAAAVLCLCGTLLMLAVRTPPAEH